MLKLYSYFRSSAAYRVRIALNLKGLSYDIVPVHLTKGGGEQRRPEYKSINPQMRVPALVVPDGQVLTQSLAIIEYLDEKFPNPPFLPADASARSRVRSLALLIACETLADACLVPQVANARRYNVPLERFPKIVAVDAACQKLPAFERARPDQQPDAE
jgi:glutathione S-transferase